MRNCTLSNIHAALNRCRVNGQNFSFSQKSLYDSLNHGDNVSGRTPQNACGTRNLIESSRLTSPFFDVRTEMPKKVLIIEDTFDIGDSLKKLIEYEGYEAVVASGGFEGLDMARVGAPDLILMDVALPDISGIDLTRELRSHPQTSEIPILCVSSYTGGIEEEALSAGCNEVFSKTSFMIAFAPTLKKYLDG